MTILSAGLHRLGASASYSRGGARKYSAFYIVKTDDVFDQAGSIILHFEQTPGLPFIGDTFAYGVESDTLAFCDGIDPNRIDRSQFVWEVEVTYSSITDEKPKVDNSGNPTEDPLAQRDEIEIGRAMFTRQVLKAKNLDALPGRFANTEGPVINSAGTPFNPQPERDDSRLVIRITKFLDTFPDHDEYADAVNSDQVTISKPGYERNFSKQTLKLTNIGGSLQHRDGVDFWRVSYEIMHSKETWVQEYLDQGLSAGYGVTGSDPNGNGGFVSPGEIKKGQPFIRRLTDANGMPVAELVLLDGLGQPLAPGKAAIYLRYSVYEELPFGVLNL